MTRTQWRWILGGAALAGFGLWLVIAATSTLRAATHEAEADDEPPVMAAAGAAVPATTQKAVTPLSPPRPTAAPAAAGTPAPAEAPFRLDPQVVEGLSERARERAELNKRWNGEAIDRGWRDQSVERVHRQLAQANLDPSALRNVDCRETICRFELGSKSARQTEVMGLINAARALGDETWLQPEANDDGTWRMEVYFPKTGYRLSSGGGRVDQALRAVDSPELHGAPAVGG